MVMPNLVPAPVAAPAEFADRARRRRFKAANKLRILAEVDRAAEHRGIGAVLRREGVYSGLVMDWRRPRDAGGLEALAPSERGPKPSPTNPKAAELAAALKENAALRRPLERAEAIIDLHKKWRSCWATRHRRTTRSSDGRRARTGARTRPRRRGLRRSGGLAGQLAPKARATNRSRHRGPPEAQPQTRARRAGKTSRAGSLARAALRRSGSGGNLRQPARPRPLLCSIRNPLSDLGRKPRDSRTPPPDAPSRLCQARVAPRIPEQESGRAIA
jgi:transposase